MAVRWVTVRMTGGSEMGDSQSVRTTGGSEMGGQSVSQDDRWQ